LDTRQKIVEVSRIDRCGKPLIVISGYFDPLHAEHVRLLSNLASPDECLAVIVSDPERPYLPLRARAELVAALRVVHYVIAVSGDVPAVVNRLAPDRVIHAEADDALRNTRLVAQIVAKHQLV
jgi:bifunctional ADP-heptose synthase (sugar kinase/adenylyltransferase)